MHTDRGAYRYIPYSLAEGCQSPGGAFGRWWFYCTRLEHTCNIKVIRRYPAISRGADNKTLLYTDTAAAAIATEAVDRHCAHRRRMHVTHGILWAITRLVHRSNRLPIASVPNAYTAVKYTPELRGSTAVQLNV